MDEFVWTQHVDHGGYFRCPVDALDDMAATGWLPCDPPEQPNPAVAEQLAWRAEQAARADHEPEPGREVEPTIAARRGSPEKE